VPSLYATIARLKADLAAVTRERDALKAQQAGQSSTPASPEWERKIGLAPKV
jgi:hypothetical protein